ncbi:MAG: DMT family transporter [Rhizobiaceae bacterium]
MPIQPAGRSGIAIAVMLLAPLMFSTNLIFGKSAVEEIAPFTLAFVRWALVAAILAPLLARERVALASLLRRDWPLVVLLGFLGMWICGALVYVAIAHTSATNGTLIYTTSPAIIILLEAALSGRRIGAREAVGCVIAFLGVAVIVLRGDASALLRLEFNIGDLLFVASAFAWAVYSILYRSSRLATLSTPALLGIVAAAGALIVLPFAAWEFIAGDPMPVTASAWQGIAGIVIVASLLAFSAFQFGVRVLGPSVAGIFMYLLPPYGVLLAATVLGEAFETYHALGIALVLGGIVLATFPLRWLRDRLGY